MLLVMSLQYLVGCTTYHTVACVVHNNWSLVDNVRTDSHNLLEVPE